MPKKVRSALPIDLLNLLGSFVGDDYHFLTFELTPKGFLSHHRIFMQSRHNPRKKCKWFNTAWGVLGVSYQDRTWAPICVRERYPNETNIKYALACRDYIKLGIIWL